MKKNKAREKNMEQIKMGKSSGIKKEQIKKREGNRKNNEER